MIKALQADVRMLKDADSRRRSRIEPEHEYGGCSGFGGHDASPFHQTPLDDMYPDMGGIGGSHVQRGIEMVNSPRMVADDENVDPSAVMGGGPEEAHVESQTGEDNGEGASNSSSNIATGVKGDHRMHTQSVRYVSPYITRGNVKKNMNDKK